MLTSKKLEGDPYWCDRVKGKRPGYRLGYIDALNARGPRMASPQYLRGYQDGRVDRHDLERHPVLVIESS